MKGKFGEGCLRLMEDPWYGKFIFLKKAGKRMRDGAGDRCSEERKALESKD